MPTTTTTPVPRTSTVPARTATMLIALFRAEARLFLRDPVTVLIAVLLPAGILAGLGSVPALRDPDPMFGGVTFVAYFAPSLLAITITQLGLQTLPTGLATYRENGVLRRFSASPVSPAAVLAVQLLISLITAAAATLLLVAVAVLVFGVPAPQHPVQFALALLLGLAAVFSIGLLIAAVAPRARTAGGIGALAFVLTLFFAGVYLPNFLLPELIVRIGAYVPPGIAAIKDSWTGAGADPVVLLVMAAVAVGATAGAARLFRWE
ncbi:MAG TPA: ABC transporter permease [Pseudonocardia sp.]|nr:ABC transporter permease [Pseudonocardia sp.]